MLCLPTCEMQSHDEVDLSYVGTHCVQCPDLVLGPVTATRRSPLVDCSTEATSSHGADACHMLETCIYMAPCRQQMISEVCILCWLPQPECALRRQGMVHVCMPHLNTRLQRCKLPVVPTWVVDRPVLVPSYANLEVGQRRGECSVDGCSSSLDSSNVAAHRACVVC